LGATINPMVEYLNSLRTQQQNSNSSYIYEARHDFLRSTESRPRGFPTKSGYTYVHSLTLLSRISRRAQVVFAFSS
jgi:hypothetical protein